MDWAYGKRREASAPPLPLLAIFSIVIFLLSFSHYSSYRDRVEHTNISFPLFFVFLPLALIFLMGSSFRLRSGMLLNLWNRNPRKQSPHSAALYKQIDREGEFPWDHS